MKIKHTEDIEVRTRQDVTVASEFERELGKLINAYVNKGLRKPDLVAKMRWVTGNCEMS